MLTLTDVNLGIRDLLDKRNADLLLTKAGKYYHPLLEEQRDALDALPTALTGGAPFAAELDLIDARHDGYGGTIYFVTEVYLRLPDAPAAIVEAARRIRLAFIPTLNELGASYPVEAERALERKPLLVSMKSDLLLFPMAGGGTLVDVATSYLAAGEEINDKLSSRADVPKGARKAAAQLRSSIVGLLGRLRADVLRELKKNSALPQDLEQKIFGYFDTLESMHQPAAAKATEEAPPAPPAPPIAPGDKPGP
jgi:hypothetical protein